MADDRRKHAVETMARSAVHMYATEYADDSAPIWAQEIAAKIREIAGEPPSNDAAEAALDYLIQAEVDEATS